MENLGHSEDVRVSQRVSYAERRGTVRFVGSLEEITGQSGVWAGVEWDQEKPGLHDGALQGRRFFQARPGSASFVLESKLQRGISARDAIKHKYGTVESDMEIGVRFGQKEVIAVGWEKVLKKVSEFDRLIHVDISSLDVNGMTCDLASVIPNVETLSLGKSLIPSWAAVSKLISGLTRLTTLNLSDNRLMIDSVEPMDTVKRLVLPQNSLVWEDVLKIISLFPALEEIFLSENWISRMSTTGVLNGSMLSVIDLDSQLKGSLWDWGEVLKLGEMTRLKTLQLSGNHLRSILVPDCPVVFPDLTHLTLRLNEIVDWRAISELNKLPRLENLKMTANPILDGIAPETARQWVIARVAGLKVLNQSPITASERRDAELDYMRRYGAEWLGIINTSPVNSERKAAFLAEHPRYERLLERFGPLDAGEVQPATRKHLKDSLIKVTLQFEEKRQEKSLPSTISVLKLKRLAERLFRIHETSQLWYVTPEKPGTRYVLDDDQKEISHYDIKTGDTIVIH